MAKKKGTPPEPKKAVKKLAEIMPDVSPDDPKPDPRDAFVRAPRIKYEFGRPTLYRPEYCDQLIEFMRKGNAFEAFATEIGTHRGTLYNWTKEHPDFLNAHSKGKDLCLRFWQDVGFAGVTNQIPFFGHMSYGMIMRHLFKYEDKDNQEGQDLQRKTFEDAMKKLEEREAKKKLLGEPSGN